MEGFGDCGFTGRNSSDIGVLGACRSPGLVELRIPAR